MSKKWVIEYGLHLPFSEVREGLFLHNGELKIKQRLGGPVAYVSSFSGALCNTPDPNDPVLLASINPIADDALGRRVDTGYGIDPGKLVDAGEYAFREPLPAIKHVSTKRLTMDVVAGLIAQNLPNMPVRDAIKLSRSLLSAQDG